MGLVGAKLGGLALLLTSSGLLGLLPFLLRPLIQGRAGTPRTGRLALALSCLQCLGGGVLLATVFAHMLPEIRDNLAQAGYGVGFPLAEVLLCAGMFSIYAIEEVAMLAAPSGGGGGDDPSTPMLGKRAEANGAAAAGRSGYGAVGDAPEPQPAHVGHSHARAAPPASLATFRVLIVATALSVHSVFEGMAIGLEPSEASVWLLTAAIATHKSIIAFCLGEQLVNSSQRLGRALATLAVFVLASPIGIILGILATSTGGDISSQALMTEVLQALAAGTILYVVLFEIIQGERAKPGSGLAKLIAILTGFTFMLLVTSLMPEPDETAPSPFNSTATPPT